MDNATRCRSVPAKTQHILRCDCQSWCGHSLKTRTLQFFTASVQDHRAQIKRTVGIARTKNVDGAWTRRSIVPLDEQIENASLYFEPTTAQPSTALNGDEQ
jgi:hypothetical protein